MHSRHDGAINVCKREGEGGRERKGEGEGGRGREREGEGGRGREGERGGVVIIHE